MHVSPEEFAEHVANVAATMQADMEVGGPPATNEELDTHALGLAASYAVGDPLTLNASAELEARMAELQMLKQQLEDCRAKDEERLRQQPMPLWTNCTRLTKALLRPLSAAQLQELNFAGLSDFPRKLFPADFYDRYKDGHANTVSMYKWACALEAILAHILESAEVSGGESIKVPTASAIYNGMKWATPSDSYFPFGAFKSTNPAFMAQVPLLKHLAEQCDSVGTGPAATEQGLATITASWAVELVKAKAKVYPPPLPFSQRSSPPG